MMRCFGLLLVLGSAFGLPKLETTPTFTWISDSPYDQVPLLTVTFPDGGDDDTAFLMRYNPVPLAPHERSEDLDSCIFHGYLEKEKDVYVTVTGCPLSDTFQVLLNSQRLKHTMFDIKDGLVTPVHEDRSRSKLIYDAIKINDDDQGPNQGRAATPLNPNGYIAKLGIYYDEGWATKFGSDSVNVVRRVMAHAQNIWMWSASLGTKVIFDIVKVEPRPGKWVTDDYLLGNLSTMYNDIGVHSNVYLRLKTPEATGPWGVAYMNGACSTTRKYHSLRASYDYSDIIVARTVAHEFGHNLGMPHDFTDEGEDFPRYDSKNQSCLQQGGIMDYASDANYDKSKWSTCSVEAFTALLNKNTTCLQAIDSAHPGNVQTQVVLTQYECDLRSINPNLQGVLTIKVNGVTSTVMCVNGICSKNWAKFVPACQSICKKDSCANLTLEVVS